jgi:hypothetical protein
MSNKIEIALIPSQPACVKQIVVVMVHACALIGHFRDLLI